MLWVIERSMFYASDQMNFIDCLKELKLKHILVDFIPFSHEIDPLPKQTTDVLAFGSTNMIRTVKKLGWSPGVWLTDEFQFEGWRSYFGEENLLNGDAAILSFGILNELEKPLFIRPCEDLKSFAGTVVHPEQFKDWKDSVTRYTVMSDEFALTDDTLVMLSEPKQIDSEHRFFVVKGQIVTGCQYRQAGLLHYTTEIDSDAQSFAQAMVDQWQPATGFVIDIAATPKGYKVIEINCLNSAGLYACDVRKLIEAIEQL